MELKVRAAGAGAREGPGKRSSPRGPRSQREESPRGEEPRAAGAQASEGSGGRSSAVREPTAGAKQIPSERERRCRCEAGPERTEATAESGVTLVEMLIAVALMGFILLGIAPLFLASMKSNFSANEYTSIHNLARDRLEQLMNLPFNDAQLAPGLHAASDLPPTLPDPSTGVPPAPGPGAVVNPFELTYDVRQMAIPPEAAVAPGAPFVPTPISAGGATYHYKRIDVTVRTRPGRVLGIGSRVSRVSGVLSNPAPATNLSVAPLPTPTP